MARESVLESKSIDLAEKRGWWYRKLKWIGRRGAPDRLFVRKGVVIFVEFKAYGKEPTIQQSREHKRMRDQGLRVEVIDNIDDAWVIFK